MSALNLLFKGKKSIVFDLAWERLSGPVFTVRKSNSNNGNVKKEFIMGETDSTNKSILNIGVDDDDDGYMLRLIGLDRTVPVESIRFTTNGIDTAVAEVKYGQPIGLGPIPNDVFVLDASTFADKIAVFRTSKKYNTLAPLFLPSSATRSTNNIAWKIGNNPVLQQGGKKKQNVKGWVKSPAGKFHALVMKEYHSGKVSSLSEAMQKASKIWKDQK